MLVELYLNMKMKMKTYLNNCLFCNIADYFHSNQSYYCCNMQLVNSWSIDVVKHIVKDLFDEIAVVVVVDDMIVDMNQPNDVNASWPLNLSLP